MWHQWFNCNFTNLREYFLCAKKTKIITLFNNSSMCHPSTIIESITMHAHGAADVEHAWTAPCLLAKESRRIQRYTLHNGARVTQENCWIKSLFLLFLCYYSRSFVKHLKIQNGGMEKENKYSRETWTYFKLESHLFRDCLTIGRWEGLYYLKESSDAKSLF